MTLFRNKALENNIIVATQEEKRVDTNIVQKVPENLVNPLSKKKKGTVKKNKSPEQAAWDERYYHDGDTKYRLVPVTGGVKPVYAVGDNDDLLLQDQKDEVEYGFSAEMLEKISQKDLAKMWKGKVADKPEGYVPSTEEISDIRHAYLIDKLSAEDQQAYLDTLSGGADTRATYRFLKDKGVWEIYHLLNLTHEYHVYQQFKDEYRQKELENYAKRKEVKESSKLPSNELAYEKQIGANCYGCAGSKIINHLLQKNMLNQNKVRGFIPRYLSRSEFQDQGIDYDYEQSKSEVEEFAGSSKSRYGNFFAISDVIFDKKEHHGLGRRDIALHKCTFNLGATKSPTAQANMIEAMKGKLHEVLKTGEPVAFFSKGHYVTIVGLSNNKISYLDSMSDKASEAITKNIDKFLDDIGNEPGLSTTELTWATKITQNSLEELKKEYDGIGIDKQTGEVVRTNNVQEFDDVAHRVGIAIRKTNAKIEADGNEDIAHYMTESVCLHRGAFMSEKQLKNWEARDEEEWAKAQQEGQKEEKLVPQSQEKQIKQEIKQEIEEEKKDDQKEEVVKEEIKINENKGEEQEAPVIEAVKEKIIQVEKKKESPIQRYYSFLNQNNSKETFFLQATRKERAKIYGSESIVMNQDEENCLISSLRCMKMFEPEVSDEELIKRHVDMCCPSDKAGKSSKIGLARKAQLMESLLAKIAAFDIHKEFNTEDPKEMVELYYKYEPLFSFAKKRISFIDGLKVIQKNKDVPIALSKIDIGYIAIYLLEIDEYGKYFSSLVVNEGKKSTEKKPDPEQRLAPDEARAKIPDIVEKKWNNFEKDSGQLLELAKQNKAYIIREKTLDARMKTAWREDAKNAVYPYDKSLGLSVIKSASIGGLDDGLCADLYRSLQYGGIAQEQEKCDAYCLAAERIFGTILSVNSDFLPQKGLSEAFISDADKYRKLCDLASIVPEVMKMVQLYRNTDSAGKALNDEQLSTLDNLCKLFFTAKLCLDEQMSEAEDTLVTGQKGKSSNAKDLEKTYEQLFTSMNEDTAEKIKAMREAVDNKYKNTQQATLQRAGEVLNERIAAGLPEFVPTLANAQLFEPYVQKYKDREKYTPSRREKEMKTEGTELYNKARFANRVLRGANVAKDRLARERRKISFNLRMGLSDEQFKAISAFFTDNASENSRLVRNLKGKVISSNKKETEEDKALAKEIAFRTVTEKFLTINTEGLNLSDDENLSLNAERLEDISLKVQAMKTLMDADPAFSKMLSAQIISAPGKEQESLYDRVMLQMDRLGRLSDHYRVRKLVMTDAYYLSHYDDEIGLEAQRGDDFEKKNLSKLLKKSKDTAALLDGLKTGNKIPEHWTTSGSTETIRALEEDHKRRAYADGRMDTSLVTEGAVKSLINEMKDFRRKHAKTPLNVKTNWPNTQELSKGYSEMFRKMLRQAYETNNSDEAYRYAEKLLPGTVDKIKELKNRDDRNRLNGYNVNMKFDDMVSMESFEYGADMDRSLNHLVIMSAGQLMSEEEILELFEGFGVSGWKDIDYSDPEQVAAAKDLYLRSYAKLYQIYSNEMKRLAKTYGFMPAQLSPISLTLATNCGTEILHHYSCATELDDIIKKQTVQMSDGRKMSILDYLVLKGYLTKEYVEESKQVANFQGGTGLLINNNATYNGMFFRDPGKEEKYQFNQLTDKGFFDSINAYRGQEQLPMLTVKEEQDDWILCQRVMSETGMAEQGKVQYASNLGAIKEQERYTASMLQLNRFIDNLASVDTSGHSKEYNYFHSCLKDLMVCYSSIAKKNSPDGKNLNPESMLILRKAYETTLKAARTYIRPKNLNHSNALYRRRYAIVNELIAVMNKDYKTLGEKRPDKSYSLSEAVEESREVHVDLTKEKIEEVGAFLSKRKVFPAEIEGEKKRWVFTETSIVSNKISKKLSKAEQLKAQRQLDSYLKYNMSLGSNIDKRNAAMSIIAKELGTQENIAHSAIGKVTISDGKKNTTLKGTIMEYIEGIKVAELKAGLIKGDIIMDNEAEIIEQLSNIQVTDYLCGNVDRHMNNVMFVMEDTGKINESTQKPILHIKRIVGIDNDFSFGVLLAKNLKRHTKKMSIPETMQLISKKTADNVLALEKERLFLMLGTTIREDEKEAMWTRVRHLQRAIMNASSENTKTGLSIVNDFSNYYISDLAGANLERGNIYHIFYGSTDYLGQKGKATDHEYVPHRFNAKEIRLDITTGCSFKNGSDDDELATMFAMHLYRGEMAMSQSKLDKYLLNTNNLRDFMKRLQEASKEFNLSIGSLFDKVSSLKDYGGGKQNQERMDLFSNKYAKSHGVNSILDVFYIDGKPAIESLPQINNLVKILRSRAVNFSLMLGGEKARITDEEIQAYHDMVAKACIMAYLVSGKKQVSIANYQKNAKGEDELVITDLNAFIHSRTDIKVRMDNPVRENGNVSLIESSRRNRQERFDRIGKYVKARIEMANKKKDTGKKG